ncbi:MAG: hypothetical protein ACOX22_10535 [Caldicoprobacterales bacterium]
MSFVKNDCTQISFNDSMLSLTERERKFLDKSWAKPFADNIFPAIKEDDFAVLYSDVASRPNTPVNIIIGSLILKELLGLNISLSIGVRNRLTSDAKALCMNY